MIFSYLSLKIVRLVLTIVEENVLKYSEKGVVNHGKSSKSDSRRISG